MGKAQLVEGGEDCFRGHVKDGILGGGNPDSQAQAGSLPDEGQLPHERRERPEEQGGYARRPITSCFQCVLLPLLQIIRPQDSCSTY